MCCDEIWLGALPYKFCSFRGGDCNHFSLAVVFLDKAVEELFKCGITLLFRLLVKGLNVFGTVDLGKGASICVSVGNVERYERIIQRNILFESPVGEKIPVKWHGVAHGKIVKRGAIGFGVGSGIKERRPVRDLLFLQLIGKGEHLLKLRFKGRRNFLRRPRRHLVLRRNIVELRRHRSTPTPAARDLLVGMGKVELEDGLERSGLRVNRRGKGGQPVGCLFIRKLLHCPLADEKRPRRIRPALRRRGLALDFLYLVCYCARQIFPLRLRDLFPGLFEVISSHSDSIKRDGGDKRSDNARDSPSDRKFFHVRIIDKIPPLCNGKNEDAKETAALRGEACRQGPSSGRSDRVRERAPRCRERPHSGSRRSGASRREAGGT